jgi:lysozyme
LSKLRGIDVSSWQHPEGAEIDWEAVYEDGFRFCMVKATQGSGYVSPWLIRDLEDARAAGLLVGAYHFVDLDADATEQADLFVNAVMGQRLELGAWIDFEPPGEVTGTPAALLTGVLQRVWETRLDAGTYTSLAVFAVLATIYVPNKRKWVADWNTAEPSPAPYLWQAGQTTLAGIVVPVDVDVLESTRGLNLPTAPKARPTDDPQAVRSAVPQLPSVSYPVEDDEDDEREPSPQP